MGTQFELFLYSFASDLKITLQMPIRCFDFIKFVADGAKFLTKCICAYH